MSPTPRSCFRRSGTEDADELPGEALQRFAAIVQRYGGQVLRFTGDGLKALVIVGAARVWMVA